VGVCGRESGSGRVEKRTDGAEGGWVFKRHGRLGWEGPGGMRWICRGGWDDDLHIYILLYIQFI